MKKFPRFYYLLLLVWLPGILAAQDHAGPDRIICLSGTTKLGPATPCSNCCYKWSPETGLDDPSKPNPVVSGLETSTIYAVTVSYPDGHYETDDVKVTLYDANLCIFEPEYFAHEVMIPENEKQIPGAQTFVNLDNDDRDADFDKDDDDVQGGDNEFIKIKVKLKIIPIITKNKGSGNNPDTADKGPEDQYAAVDLAGGTTISGIRLWLSNDKLAGEY